MIFASCKVTNAVRICFINRWTIFSGRPLNWFCVNTSSNEIDSNSKDKQTYIEAFIADEPDNLFLKPGKIQFPTDERMRKHNEERSFAKGKIKTAYKIRAKVNKNYGETDLLK